MTADIDARTPVSLLTGFLGSGKTTLLNGWLRDPALADAAVIVNEFGDVGIDHTLIATSNDNTIELSTGCLCCTVRGDLVETLRELSEKRRAGEVRAFSRVLIETTGLADPAPVIQALMSFPVAGAYRLSRVVTAVDAVNGLSTIDRFPEATKQIAIADEIVVTKTDMDAPDLTSLRERLAKINPGARIHNGRAGSLPQAGLLNGADIYDPATKHADVLRWLGAEKFQSEHDGHSHANAGPSGDRHDHTRHSAEIETFCLEFDAPLHWEHVAAWLDALALAHSDDLLRVKGILDIAGRSRPIVVQAVQRLFHPPTELAAWPPNERRSQIVFITRGLTKAFVSEVLAIIQTRKPAGLSLALDASQTSGQGA
jgi:G3E family GTPase